MVTLPLQLDLKLLWIRWLVTPTMYHDGIGRLLGVKIFEVQDGNATLGCVGSLLPKMQKTWHLTVGNLSWKRRVKDIRGGPQDLTPVAMLIANSPHLKTNSGRDSLIARPCKTEATMSYVQHCVQRKHWCQKWFQLFARKAKPNWKCLRFQRLKYCQNAHRQGASTWSTFWLLKTRTGYCSQVESNSSNPNHKRHPCLLLICSCCATSCCIFAAPLSAQ